MEIEIETLVIGPDENPIPEGSQRITMVKPDKYKELVGDGNARTSITVAETIDGPRRFTSVRISCTVTLNCNQSADSIEQAKAAAFEECVVFIDEHVYKAYAVLTAHLERLCDEG